jgi:DNA-binding transcriptional ArsR family regulator
MTNFTPLPNFALHQSELNKNQFFTYCLILEHCWNPETSEFDWTLPISTSQLAKILDIPRRTLSDHIDALTSAGMIHIHRYSSLTLSLIPTVTGDQPPESAGSRLNLFNTSLIKTDSLSDSKEETGDQPPLGGAPPVAVEIVEYLRKKGVADTTRLQLAASGRDLGYFKAWFRYADITGQALNYTCNALLSDLPEPEICRVCLGVDGEHKGVVDEDNGYLMCPRDGRPELSARDVFEIYGEMSPV